MGVAQAGVLGDGWNAPHKVFDKYVSADSPSGWGGYRIPGITATAQGTLVAIADKRFTGTGGNTDIHDSQKVRKVWFSYKVSKDGGRTWSEEGFLKPPTFSDGNINNDAYKNYITDPQIVHDPDAGLTFAFGYQTNSHVLNHNGKDFDIFMFTSKDGGLTWDEGKSIKSAVDISDVPTGGNRWSKALQGPGNGMYYNGVIYVPVQKWGNQNGTASTSGYIYSTDHGETWQSSEWLLTNTVASDHPTSGMGSISQGLDGNGIPFTSESSVFHHKGYIYLAAKDEGKKYPNRRVVWRTNNHGKSWERVIEDFIHENVVGCETSTFALNDDVYFVGYTTSGGNGNNQRNETYITSNTGKRIKLFDSDNWSGKESYGYTSITADQDNLYVLFEGVTDGKDTTAPTTAVSGAILTQNFDYAGKEYANLNGRLLRSSKDMRYIQDTVMNTKDNYIRGSFGDDDQYGAEAIFRTDYAKLALFHKSSKDLGDDVYRTYAYDEDTTTALVATDNVIFNEKGFLSDSVFAGYQYSTVDYANGADDEVHSIIAGYAVNMTTDYVDYQLKINGKFSKHDLTRNNSEGLGKSAEFDSKVISITNEFSKNFELFGDKLNVRPFVGLDSTYFEHDGFNEKGGNGFNDITMHANDNWSHGLYAGAQLSGTYPLKRGMSLEYKAKARYVHELSDIDDWTDSYTVFDTDFMFAAPVNKNDQENLFEASASVVLNVNERVGLGVGANFDSADENMVFGQLKINF